MGDNIKVMCRFRPLNKMELGKNTECVAEFVNSNILKIKKELNDTPANGHEFAFDYIFPMDTSQKEIYEVTAKPVVQSCLSGFNGTIFAYGQTSSGKSFTMQGSNINDDELKGITPRMIDEIFAAIEETPESTEFQIQLSITEIYQEKLRDLLDITQTDLKVRESTTSGIYVAGVTAKYVATRQEVWDYMETAFSNRAVGHTNMNEGSSRSHLIVMLSIYQNDKLVPNVSRASSNTGKEIKTIFGGSGWF